MPGGPRLLELDCVGLLTQLAAPAFVADVHGRCVHANNQWLSLVGRTEAEVIGRAWDAPFHQRGVGHHDENAASALVRIELGQDEERYVQLTVLANAAGRSGLLGLALPRRLADEERELESGPRSSVIPLEPLLYDGVRVTRDEPRTDRRTLEAMSRLAGGVAHDLNNTLGAVLGFAEALHDEFPLDDPRRSDLCEVMSAAQRGSDLARQLLIFSRRQACAPQALALGEVLGESKERLRSILGEQIELVIEEQCAHDLVYADRAQLEEVLLCFASNARDAMLDGGQLIFGIERVNLPFPLEDGGAIVPEGTYVRLSVHDTGAGMDPHTRKHLFEPFFSTRPLALRRGLGLSTVYGILQQASTPIAVSSEVGQGTTFRLYFPTRGAEPRSERAPSEGLATSGLTLLLAEDDPALRAVLARMLRRCGHRVLVAADAEDAARACAEHVPRVDLIITSMATPGLCLDLFQRVKARRPELEVLLLSSIADEIQGGPRVPGVHVLEMPFTEQELDAAVSRALGAPDRRRASADR